MDVFFSSRPQLTSGYVNYCVLFYKVTKQLPNMSNRDLNFIASRIHAAEWVYIKNSCHVSESDAIHQSIFN